MTEAEAVVAHAEAVLKLKLYVTENYNGSIEANFKLDELLWDVKIAHPNGHSDTLMKAPQDPGRLPGI